MLPRQQTRLSNQSKHSHDDIHPRANTNLQSLIRTLSSVIYSLSSLFYLSSISAAQRMLDQSILDWLFSIPCNAPPDSSAQESGRKRRHNHALPSPTMSDHEISTSPSKRICIDLDATPTRRSIRPTSELSSRTSSRGYNSASASSSPTKRTGSSRASSTKDIALLRQDRIVASRTFNDLQGQPPSLRAMVRALKRDMRGDGIISQDTLVR